MNPAPRVSVIMPAFNVADYIEAAIRSAFAQTVTDAEVVVADDGSTDATPDVLARLRQEFGDRLVVVRGENRGLPSARNAALARARGRYFALLDSDDYWTPEFLAAQLSILEGQPDVAIVTGNGWYHGGPLNGRPVRPHPDPRPEPVLASIIEDERAIFVMSVFRREVYDRIGGFNESFRTNEDYDYWLRAAAAGFRFKRNSEPLAYYRVRDESLSADEERMIRGILRVYRHFRPSIACRAPEVAALDRQVRRFEAELFALHGRSGAPVTPNLSHREFIMTLLTWRGDRKRAVAAVLGRYSPNMFRQVRTLRGRRTAAPLAGAVPAGSDLAGREYWDAVWAHADFPADIDPGDRSVWAYRDQEFHRFFQEQLGPDTAGRSVLELGCAQSAWLPYFARQFGFRLSGLDYSELGVAKAVERLKRHGIAADIRCADLFKPPADWVGAFDLVVWFGVAEHFEDTTAAIRAAAAYVKPGGLLVTEIPNLAGVTGWLQRWFNRPIYDIHVPLSREALVRHHVAAGLEVTASRYALPVDFGVVNLDNLPPSFTQRVKDRVMYGLRLLTGCVWWLDRRFGPVTPPALTSGFVLVAGRKPVTAGTISHASGQLAQAGAS